LHLDAIASTLIRDTATGVPDGERNKARRGQHPVHIPDGYLSPIFSIGLGAVTIPAWSLATRRAPGC